MRLADPVHVRAWRAELQLEYERRASRTVLAWRRHDGPLVVQKPLYPEGDAVCHTIVVHPPGGIAGGDELDVAINIGAGGHVLLTTPGECKWYRSGGPLAQQRVALTAAHGACVEWLPQETIVYDGAHAGIEVVAELGRQATFIGWDIVCLGRTASGERYAKGNCRLHTRIAREGRLLWMERGAVEGGGSMAMARAGLAGRTVFGTMLAASPGVGRDLVEACRSVQPESGMGAVTQPPGLLVARYLGDSSEAARRYFEGMWKRIREPLTGRAATAPRIWNT